MHGLRLLTLGALSPAWLCRASEDDVQWGESSGTQGVPFRLEDFPQDSWFTTFFGDWSTRESYRPPRESSWPETRAELEHFIGKLRLRLRTFNHGRWAIVFAIALFLLYLFPGPPYIMIWILIGLYSSYNRYPIF